MRITVVGETGFTKPTLAYQRSVKIVGIKFNKNPSKALIADTRSHRNGWTDVEST